MNDWQTHIQQLIESTPEDIRTRIGKLRLVAFDVDGTLTDGRLHFSSDEREQKSFHAHDGLGLKMLQDAGIKVALISKRHSEIIHRRGKELGIEHIYGGKAEKLDILAEIAESLSIDLQEMAFMGDDLPDLRVMQHVLLAVAPANAHFAVKVQAHLVTEASGGFGAARAFCDRVLAVRGVLGQGISAFMSNAS